MKKAVKFTVTIDVDTNDSVNENSLRQGIIDAIRRQMDWGYMSAEDEDDSIVTGYTVVHESTTDA